MPAPHIWVSRAPVGKRRWNAGRSSRAASRNSAWRARALPNSRKGVVCQRQSDGGVSLQIRPPARRGRLASASGKVYICSMAYDPELPSCFDERDLILAAHPIDKGRAFAWLIKLRNKEALWADVRRQIEEFLRERHAREAHIRQQVERARILFGPWLYGREEQE